MGKSSLPAQLEAVPALDASEIVNNLMELRSLGKPQSDAEVESRCNEYFRFCSDYGLRPGIEGLSLSLGIDRTTLWRWRRGEGCSLERSEIIRAACQLTIAYIEAAELSGKVNPVSAIFAKKNWAGYSDSIRIEDVRPNMYRATMTPEEIADQIEKDIPIDADFEN